jgi:hypothetical protein
LLFVFSLEGIFEKMSDSSEMYLSHRELMNENELEEVDFEEGNGEVETYPSWFHAKLMSMMMLPDPDDEGRDAFLKREPALSFSLEELQSLRGHWSCEDFLPVQRRKAFDFLRLMMLRKLISCDGAKGTEDLLLLLESEIKTGASPVPKWYKFEAARKRGFGYQACSARSCYSTEAVEKMFGYCSGCRISFYCSIERL